MYWFVIAALVLFVTHVGRMRSADTWLGLISPFVATAGDFAMAFCSALSSYRCGSWCRRLTVRSSGPPGGCDCPERMPACKHCRGA